MRLPLSLRIAYRYLYAKRDNGFISFITFVSVSGLILGTATLIIVLSALNGFEQKMQDKLLSVIPHIQLTALETVPDWQQKAKIIKESDPDIKTVTPTLAAQVMILDNKKSELHAQKNPTQPNQVVTLIGVVPEYEQKIPFLSEQPEDGQGIIQGSLNNLTSTTKQPIIIGEHLAKDLNVGIGNHLLIVLPKPTDSAVGITPISQQFTVVGIFKLSRQTERYIAFTHIQDIANILGIPAEAQSFRLQLHDVFNIEKTIQTLSAQYPDYILTHWKQTHGSIYQTLKNQKITSGLLLLLIVLVAAFNLIASLIMMVREKQAQIAILQTIGASPRFICAIFLWQGVIVGFVGVLGGGLLGLFVAHHIGEWSHWVNHTFQLNLFDGYFVAQIPSVIQIGDVVLVLGVSWIIAIGASLYPALKATRIEPALALNYDK